MTRTVLGVFSARDDAENAIDKLKASGFNPKDISIVMKDTREGEDLAEDTGASMAAGAASGAATGAAVGGLAGLLASFVLPGLGAFFIGGPIASALGLTGAAAATASGAATGAVAGGILGALMGFGLSEDEAQSYEERVKQGAILLAVPVQTVDTTRVSQILSECNAVDVKSVSSDERVDRFESRTTASDFVGKDDGVYTDYNQSAFVSAGAKGGKAGSEKGKKDGKTKGRGWHGDSKDHSLAGQGKDVPGRGEGK